MFAHIVFFAKRKKQHMALPGTNNAPNTKTTKRDREKKTQKRHLAFLFVCFLLFFFGYDCSVVSKLKSYESENAICLCLDNYSLPWVLATIQSALHSF